MRLRRLFVVAAAMSAAPGAALAVATPADAAHVTFCSNVLLQSGTTCDTNPGANLVLDVNADAISSAKPCAQMVSPYNINYVYGQTCSETEGARVTYLTNSGTTAFNPAVHDHSTHQGRFNGSFSY